MLEDKGFYTQFFEGYLEVTLKTVRTESKQVVLCYSDVYVSYQ